MNLDFCIIILIFHEECVLYSLQKCKSEYDVDKVIAESEKVSEIAWNYALFSFFTVCSVKRPAIIWSFVLIIFLELQTDLSVLYFRVLYHLRVIITAIFSKML